MTRTKSSRRNLLAGVAAAPIVLAACGGDPDIEAVPLTGVSAGKVVYGTWGPTHRLELEHWTLLAFEKNYPDLKVDVVSAPTSAEYVAKQYSLLSAGTPPDVVRLPSWSAPTFYNEEALRQLDGFFRRDGFSTDNLAQPFDVATFKRRWYALPRGTAGTWVVFCNRRLLDAAGIKTLPTAWTWDDFMKAARDTTRPNAAGGAQWGVSLDSIVSFYYPWLWGNGGDDLERTGEKALIDQPPAREAMQWLADLRHKHRVAPPAGELPDSLAAFAAGRLAFWFGPADTELELARQNTVDFSIAPQPKGKAGQQAGFKPDVVGLSTLSQYVDDAWEMLQFLVDVETQRQEFTNGLWLPQAKSIVDEAGYQKPATAPYDRRPGIPNALLRARSPLMLPRSDDIRAAALKELAPVWQGARSVEDATTAAAAAMNAILNGEA
jgi:ABC-type glycerol-3-phosphate transport system substrate-binding protein